MHFRLVKQRNAISMGFAKQKFSIETRRNLEHCYQEAFDEFVETKFQFCNFLKMTCLSCRKCSEDFKTFRGLKIGPLLRKLYAF